MYTLILMVSLKLEHWILCYSRMDPVSCQNLSNCWPELDLSKVKPDIVLLEKDEMDYLKSTCKIVLAKKISEMGSGFSFILKQVPFQPLHNYTEMFEKQNIFVEALEPLNEGSL